MFNLVKYDTYIICLIAFLTFGFYYQFHFQQIDAIIFLNSIHTKWSDTFFSFITRLGEELPYFALILFYLFRKDYKNFVGLALSGIIIMITVYLLKDHFLHPRPLLVFNTTGIFARIKPVDGVILVDGFHSFPSGHTATAFSFYGYIAFTFPNKRFLQFLLISLAIIVGLSRIYLAQHFPEDVLFGSVVGTLVAITSFLIASNWLPSKTTSI